MMYLCSVRWKKSIQRHRATVRQLQTLVLRNTSLTLTDFIVVVPWQQRFTILMSLKGLSRLFYPFSLSASLNNGDTWNSETLRANILLFEILSDFKSLRKFSSQFPKTTPPKSLAWSPRFMYKDKGKDIWTMFVESDFLVNETQHWMHCKLDLASYDLMKVARMMRRKWNDRKILK